jgi:hypothetical protein
MLCPFRKKTTTKVVGPKETHVATEEFMECYGEPCPFYYRYENGDYLSEKCIMSIQEN